MRLSWVAIAACVATTSFANSSHPIVLTTYGPVFTADQGDDGVVAYKGIPYAAAPVGNLRWRPPLPPQTWTTPFNATSFGPTCYSFISGGSTTPGPESEDCLTMNVWAPADALAGRPLPVMVFIHGGGFQFDSVTNPTYNGARFAQLGVILVSFDYRLGNLGFLAHDDLDKENPESKSGNFGLQDQIFALQWVRDNIAAFGGDNQNVLAFGESAGAHAIGILMASPAAQGLFDKALIESGSWWDSEHGSLTTYEQARKMGAVWANKFAPNASLADLRTLPVETVVNTSLWDFSKDPGVTAFSPSIDGHIVPMVPAQAFSMGIQSKVPLLVGWNKDEGTLFQARALPSSTAQDFKGNLSAFFDVPGHNATHTNDRLTVLYPATSEEEAALSALALLGDLVIAQQTWEAADLHSSTSGMAGSTYAYHLTYTSPYSPQAVHAAELPFVFGNLEKTSNESSSPSQEDREFSDQLMRYWINFATTGNPNEQGQSDLPYWPAYSSGHQVTKGPGGNVQELGTEIHHPAFSSDRFEFIRTFRTQGALPKKWRTFQT